MPDKNLHVYENNNLMFIMIENYYANYNKIK